MRICKVLTQNGIFVTSTICLEDSKSSLKFIASLLGKTLGLNLKVFTKEELRKSITNVGFQIDYEWQPEGEDRVVFIVAKKIS